MESSKHKKSSTHAFSIGGRHMQHSEKINEILSALSNARKNLARVKKTKKNTYYKSKYADLTDVMNACEEKLRDQGIEIMQSLDAVDEKSILHTRLIHSSGQWIGSSVCLSYKQGDSQSHGSAISYMRRYSLVTLVGICVEDEDDDGNAACGREKIKGQDEPHKSKSDNKEPQKTNENIPIITKAEADELIALLIDCGAEFSQNVVKYINNELKIKSFYQLRRENYASLRNRIIAKYKEKKSKELTHV
jgi:hypothetical protein